MNADKPPNAVCIARHKGLQVVVAACALATSIANAQLYADPVTTALRPYIMYGYEILPPPGGNWFEMKRDRHNLYFGKRIISPTHSLIAMALSVPLEESFKTPESFRLHIVRQLSEKSSDRRNATTAMAVQAAPLDGAFCVRYQTRGEDRRAPNAKGDILIAETVGLSCLHGDGKLLIDASYTERGRTGEIGGLLQDEGEAFIRGLKLTPPI